MAGSPTDVKAKLDSALAFLGKTTSSGASFVKSYGADWTKWPPTSNWYQAYSLVEQAEAELQALFAVNVTATPPAVLAPGETIGFDAETA